MSRLNATLSGRQPATCGEGPSGCPCALVRSLMTPLTTHGEFGAAGSVLNRRSSAGSIGSAPATAVADKRSDATRKLAKRALIIDGPEGVRARLLAARDLRQGKPRHASRLRRPPTPANTRPPDR